MQNASGSAPSASKQSPLSPPRIAVRPWRTLLVGVFGVIFLCALTPYNDYHLHNTFLYGNHLPIGGLFLFALLAMAVNPLLTRYARRWAFQPGELLLIWAMLTCGAGLASSGLWRYLGPMVVAPAYFARSGSPWLSGFAQCPDWLLLTRDPKSDAALWFYQGLPPGQSVPWGVWGHVVVAWGIAFGGMVMLSLGLAALFRKQWVTHERLTYPLAQLPLRIVSDSQAARPLTRQYLFWAGCVTVVVLHGWSTAHAFAPSIPDAPDRIDLAGWLQAPPWNALGISMVVLYFAVVGIVYLLPADVSLTLWTTFVALHLFRVFRVTRGLDPLVIGPLNHEGAMGTGAFLFWAVWLCRTSSRHWKAVWQAVLHPQSASDEDAPLSARAALVMVVLGSGGLLAWMALAGIPLPMAALLLLLMGVILLVLARIMAEAGLLFLMTPFIPTDLMAFWGTQYYNPTSASVALLTQVVLIHDPREHVMPAITNAYALSGSSGLRPRAFTAGIALAILVGFVVSFYAFVGLNYRYGAITLDSYGTSGAPHWSLDRAVAYVRMPLSANAGDLQALSAGALLAALFVYLKSRYLWWPFGPIGLAMGSTYAMNRIWGSVFIGWLCKALTVRLGGLRAYHKALPYFLGLVLGEGLFAGISVLWGMLTGAPTPQFLPN
ncbi:MAG TPA: DUF6785 family protein [Chthonomonadaceae bacterium]|nr:DUF6785 family protein [Chthonomonadaceae bacterium]